MAAWQIEQFSVKPAGIFASTRYKRVLVDENGLLTNTGVPGKETMNLPCTTDYKRVYRVHKSGDLITTFCNLDTFTNYRVYAQDCEPFAYVQTDLNAPNCGYLADVPPLPPITDPFPAIPVTPPVQDATNPAVPADIFGALLPYGLYKFMDFCDVENVPILVNIYRKSFIGVAAEIETGGQSPVKLSYKCDENKFNWIRPLECKLSFICDANFSLSELYSSDEREFGVEVLKDGALVFTGYVIPDSCNEPFMPPPYEVTIRASDGLSALKKITYPLPSGSKINLRQSFLSILAYCLNKTDTNLGISTICNLYDIKMLNGLDDDPLAQSSVNPLRFTHDNGYLYNVYEVLEAVCIQFGAYITQINGAWHFVRVNELSQDVIRKRIYNSTGLFFRGENTNPLRNAGLSEEVQILNGGEINIGNAYKRVEVLQKFGNMPAIVFNGDFELWDGDNFNNWTRYGGINISRVQNTVKGVGGALIPIPDYSIQFNEKYDPGKWLEADPILVLPGDKITIYFNVGDTISRFARFKMRIKIGQYYLYNENDAYSWVQSLAVVTYDIKNMGGSVRDFIATIPVPPVPLDASSIIVPMLPSAPYLTVQILGFSQMLEYTYSVFGVKVTSSEELNTFTPIVIDNFSIKKTSEENKDIADSSFNVASQLGFYTEIPPLVETIFGDYIDAITGLSTPTSSLMTNSSNVYIKKDLYAIYTRDNSYSKGWIDYGQSSTPLPINLILANVILKAYQKPFRYFVGSFKGQDLNYLDTFNLIVNGQTEFSSKIFTWLDAEFDLKFNTVRGSLAEVFSKNIPVTNVSVPINPGIEPPRIGGLKDSLFLSLGIPPLTNNPNNPSTASDNEGIFTEQFTNQFL